MNLLPPSEKRKIHRDYVLRFAATSATLFSAAVFIGIGALLPSFLLAKGRIANLKAEAFFSFSVDNNTKVEELKEILAETADKIKVLVPESRLSVVSTIKKIISLKPDGVRIVSFSYNLTDNKISVFTIRGIARGRTDISDFIGSLRSNPSFKDIEVPVSDFAKAENVEFSLSLKQDL